MHHVHITGTGLITALGKSVEETWAALLEGKFIRDHSRCSTGFQPVPDGETGAQRHGLQTRHYSLCSSELPRVTTIGLSASREAVRHANWSDPDLRDNDTALIVGTSKGPIEAWMTAPPESAYRTNEIGLHEVA